MRDFNHPYSPPPLLCLMHTIVWVVGVEERRMGKSLTSALEGSAFKVVNKREEGGQCWQREGKNIPY